MCKETEKDVTSLLYLVQALCSEKVMGHKIEPGKATQQHDKLIRRHLPAQLASLLAETINDRGPVVTLCQLVNQPCHLNSHIR
jgi:hypothetical protein